MLVQGPRSDLFRGLGDQLRACCVQLAQVAIGTGGGQLDEAERANELAGKAIPADGEIQHRPLGGGAVESRIRHLHLAHGILLGT